MEASTAEETRSFPSRIGRYEILCELGHGGMAVLYLARSVGLGGFERLFAIKMIHEHLGKEQRFVQMFLDEARLVARIRHPNVIPVYEVDVDRARYYLSMDYISGETLGAALSASWPKGKAVPIELAVYMIANAAEGLHAAHELRGPNAQSLGVIHRDISPHNIMLGYDGSIRVMDFGVAKALDQIAHSRPGTFKGTPAYMSPEQIRGGVMDRRSDIFGLGVILWEATVGKRLFKDKNDIATAARVLKMKVPLPSSFRRGYPPRITQIIEKAMSRDPTERHQTARHLSEELHDYLAKSGKRVSAGDVESFMLDVFADRVKERRELEQKAMSPLPIAALPSTLTADDDELQVVSLDEALDLDIDTDASGLIDAGLVLIKGDTKSTIPNSAGGAVPASPLGEASVSTAMSSPPKLEVTERMVNPLPFETDSAAPAPVAEPAPVAPTRPSTALISLAVAELSPPPPQAAKPNDLPTRPSEDTIGAKDTLDAPVKPVKREIVETLARNPTVAAGNDRPYSDSGLVVPVPDSALGVAPVAQGYEHAKPTLLIRDRNFQIEELSTPGESTAEMAGLGPHKKALAGVALALLTVMGLAYLVARGGSEPTPPPARPARAPIPAEVVAPATAPATTEPPAAEAPAPEPPAAEPPADAEVIEEAPIVAPPAIKDAKSRPKRNKGKKWTKPAPALFRGSDL